MKRKPMATSLDKNPIVRQKLRERLMKAINNDALPVAVLHQMLQALEMWTVDFEAKEE